MAMAMATTPSTVTATTSPHSHTFFLRCSPALTFTTKSKHSPFNACKNLASSLTTNQSRNSSGHVKNPILFLTGTSTSTSSSAPMIVCLAAASGGGDNSEVVDEGDKVGDDTAKGVGELNLVSEADLLKKKAKKVLQRRKRLLRKRKLRKKGRWPPSKMAKLKNV